MTSSAFAIRTDRLSKRYRLAPSRWRQYGTLREALGGRANARRVLQSTQSESTTSSTHRDEDFWALKDVSFEVKPGEIVGLIGRNGAGKSTLLKILSRITDPTSGHAEIRGRVSALLDVGTGFHPELTGRENIFLNGAVLGMKRTEIRRKFDEIVAFSEVEKFLEMPVKYFSSGQYMRLAFAVAAHLEPEVLFVDEVLAVGDHEFQKKCLGKMSLVARQGRTVLLVSHDLAAVSNLCSTVYRLEGGQIVDHGDAAPVIRRYVAAGDVRDSCDLATHPGRKRGVRSLLQSVRWIDGTAAFSFNETFGFECECLLDDTSAASAKLGFRVRGDLGQSVFGASMDQHGVEGSETGGRVLFRALVKSLPLAPGTYSLSLSLETGGVELDAIEEAVHFTVLWEKQTDIASPPRANWGPLHLPVSWEVERLQR